MLKSKFLFKISSVSLIVTSFSLLLTSCGGEAIPKDLDQHVLSLAKQTGMTGDPTTGRLLPSITDDKAQLGKRLFFSKGLGGDSDSACVSCHHPVLGGGDNLSLSIGVGALSPDLLGKGRSHAASAAHFDGGPTVPRNAPTTFNLALWDQALFLDGRVESLGKTVGKNGNDSQGIRTPDSAFGVADTKAGKNLSIAQARFPVTSPEEMQGFVFKAGKNRDAVRTGLAEKMADFSGWKSEFQDAFGDSDITFARMAEAIAEYERSQIFVNNPWKKFMEGDKKAISRAAKRGALMFFNTVEKGGANCVSCHSGDFFTNELYHVTATPQIGRGKGDDNGSRRNDDFGRARETKRSSDRYKFRTPTLLNVEMTGPWGHAGAYTTLNGMVKHMLNPQLAIEHYDFSQLEQSIQTVDMKTNTRFALEQLKKNQLNKVSSVLQNIVFQKADVTDLVAFLKTLTDPCIKSRACLAPWIPNAQDSNPDGLRVNAVNRQGGFL
ncbi:MAG: hypothetical protein KAG28_00055 [Cocleimonas sp.]|nr:hypothetical protein [Cocleimonas sp.]